MTPEERRSLDRQATDEEFREQVRKSFAGGDERMDAIETALAQNTRVTNSIKENTDEMVSVFNSGKGGLKVLGWLGAIAKWLVSISAGFAAVFVAWKAMGK